MSNPFYYLFGLLLVFSYPTGLEPLAFVRPESRPEITTPAAVGLAFLLYAFLVASVHRRVRVTGRFAVLGRARLLLRLVALLLFAVLLFVFHLPLRVWAVVGREILLVEALLILSPLFGFYGIYAVLAGRFDAAMRSGGSGGSLGFAFRSFLALSFLPVLAMLGLYTAFENLDPLWRLAYVYPFAGWVVVVVWIFLLLAFLPLLLRFAFAAGPLPPGPLRARLEELCRTVGFRYSRILVVRTGGLRMANAFIVGLGIPWRYVFFTDALLEGMTPDELECVLAHEIVHSKKRHMLFYVFFTVGFSLAAVLSYELLAALPEAVLALVLLAGGAAYWIGAFGYVSRRFETEADLVAARWVPAPPGAPAPYGSARAMAGALGRVAALNRMPLTGWSWRHFNISTRIAILMGAEADSAVGAAFETQCVRLRGAALTLLVVGVVAGGFLAFHQAGEADAARARLAAYERIEDGRRMFREKAYDTAADALRAGIAGGWDQPSVWALLAECERRRGREEEARAAEGRAREGNVTHPLIRLQLEESPGP